MSNASQREKPRRGTIDHGRTLTYSTDSTRVIAMWVGVLIAVVALFACGSVLLQWLAWSPGDKPLSTSPGSLIPGFGVVLWGVWLATHHVRVALDREARTVTWTTYGFWLSLRRVTWEFSDVTAITLHENNSIKSQGYSARASGPRGSLVLLDYFHGVHAPPAELRETASALGLELGGPASR